MITLGVPMAPFIFGLVAVRINGVQFILYFLLGRETLYLRGPTPSMSPPPSSSQPSRSLLCFRRLDPTPLRVWDFVKPLTFFRRPCVLIPTVAYAMVFLWANIMMSVKTGSLFPENFGLDPQAVSLQNIAIIVGSLVGKQNGGFLSDWWMWRCHAKHLQQGTNNNSSTTSSSDNETTDQVQGMNRKTRQPEFRHWLAYPGFLLTIPGVVVYLVQIGAADYTWNVTPDVGMGIAAGGSQIVTTVMTTYAVDCYRDEAASIGVFINFVRQTWGLIGPFWFPELIATVGLGATAGIAAAILVAVSMIPMGGCAVEGEGMALYFEYTWILSVWLKRAVIRGEDAYRVQEGLRNDRCVQY
ncbi:uncharacterized protein B0T15DRAFT_545760 [Chaetomium strumarium]|uniref:Uncharacterized protein n=1 Tax=Chaetomium strumarium TaxID=1170767 RepID=A0AAJ0H1E3_9PEZI|nr:hypothetical protein B0T15DRAFT_545760 [Chaetomium strumarium]